MTRVRTLGFEALGEVYDGADRGLPSLGTTEGTADRERLLAYAPEECAERLGRRYTALCGAAGFAFGLPGYAAMPLTIPSKVAGVAALQLHLAASIAALLGEHLPDASVRARRMACVAWEEDPATGAAAAIGSTDEPDPRHFDGSVARIKD